MGYNVGGYVSINKNGKVRKDQEMKKKKKKVGEKEEKRRRRRR